MFVCKASTSAIIKPFAVSIIFAKNAGKVIWRIALKVVTIQTSSACRANARSSCPKILFVRYCFVISICFENSTRWCYKSASKPIRQCVAVSNSNARQSSRRTRPNRSEWSAVNAMPNIVSNVAITTMLPLSARWSKCGKPNAKMTPKRPTTSRPTPKTVPIAVRASRRTVAAIIWSAPHVNMNSAGCALVGFENIEYFHCLLIPIHRRFMENSRCPVLRVQQVQGEFRGYQ